MAESYSVKAILSAQDKNFSSIFKNAMGTSDKLGKTTKSLGEAIKGTALGMGVFKAAGAGVSMLNSHLDSAIDRYDTMNQFPKIMSNLGIGAKDSSKAIKTLSKGLTGLPTTLDSAAGGVTNFTSKNGDIGKSTEYFLALNNAIIAGGQSTSIQQSALEQLSQAYSKGGMDMMEWRSLQTAMPAQLKQVAKAMNMSADEMGEGLRNGTVSMDDFMDTIVKLNKRGVKGFASFEKQAKSATGGIKTAFTNVGTAATRGIANCIGAVDTLLEENGLPGIGQTAINVSGYVDKAFARISGAIEKIDLKGAISVAAPYWKAFSGLIRECGGAFGKASGAVGTSLGEMAVAFLSNEGTIEKFQTTMKTAGDAASAFAEFLTAHSDIIAEAAPKVLGLLAAYKGFKMVKTVAPALSVFTGAIGGLAKKGLSKIAPNLFKVSEGQEMVGRTSAASAKQMAASAKAFMMTGASVLLISAGFWLLSDAAVKLAGAGPLAIGVMAGMVVAIGGLLLVAQAVAPALSAGAVGFVAFGAAMLLAGAGMMLLTNAAINLAGAGPLAIGVMVGMIAVIALLAVGVAVLGPALMLGGVGMMAFGAGLILVSAAALLAGVALNLVAAALPMISQHGLSGAAAIAALGASLIVFGVSAAAAGLGAVVLGGALIMVAAGLALAGAGAFVAAAGFLALSAGAVVLGAGLMLVSASVMMLGALLPVAASGAVMSAAAFAALMAASVGLSAVFIALAAATGVYMGVSLAGAGTTAVFAAAMAAGALGTAAMGLALKAVNSSMKSIAKNAKSSQKSLSSMRDSVSIVNSGLDALGSKAKSAIESLTSAFSGGSGKARSAGKEIADGIVEGTKSGLTRLPDTAKTSMGEFHSGIQSGGVKAKVIATTISAAIVASMNSASSGAYKSGVYIGQGLANGMRATLGTVQAIAAQLAAAAAKAIDAKAKVHSPSRVTMKSGKYIALGLGKGIADNIKSAVKSSISLAKTTFHSFGKANGNYEKLGERLVKKYKSGIETNRDKVIESVKNLIEANVNELKKKNKKAASSYSKAGSALTKAFTTSFKSGAKKAVSAAESAINKIGKKYQKLYDNTISARTSFRESLSDVGSLYTVDDYGYMSFKNFKAGTAQINAYAKNLAKLKKVLPKGLMNEILQLDTASGLAYTKQLLKKSSKELKAYGKTYTNYQNAARRTSNRYYKADLAGIKKNFNKAVNTEFKNLSKKLKIIGQNAMQGFVNGMNSKKKTLDSAGKALAGSVLKQFKKVLKIHSPSRALMKVGKFTGEGYVEGLQSMLRKVQSVTADMIAIPQVASGPELSFAGHPGGSANLSEKYEYYRSAQYTIIVPVELEGCEIAKATAPYTEEELNKREKRSNRKRGRK